MGPGRIDEMLSAMDATGIAAIFRRKNQTGPCCPQASGTGGNFARCGAAGGKCADRAELAARLVVELLRRQRTRLVGIDNVHAILTACGRARRDTLDAFRFLMSEGNVPMVVAGLDVAADIFSEDVELAYRSIKLGLEPEPLAYRVRPLAEECFDSWIERVAAAHETTRSGLFRHLGIDGRLAGCDLARGTSGVAGEHHVAVYQMVGQLASAVQIEPEHGAALGAIVS